MRRVVVVGAGIIGAFTALYLARRNIQTTVIECHQSAFHGNTAAGFGSLTPYSDPFFRGQIGLFAASSVNLYRTDVLPYFSKLLSRDVFISENSLLQLFEDEREAQKYMTGSDGSQPLTVRLPGLKFLSKIDAIKLEPNLTKDFHSAIEFEEPWVDIETLLECLDTFLSGDSNCKKVLGTTVERIEERPTGVRVVLSNGFVEEADCAVLATGAGLAPIAGIPSPQISLIRGDGAIALTATGKPLISRHVYMGKAFITPRQDGRHLLGASYESVHESPKNRPASARTSVNFKSLAAILASTQKLLPGLADCEITRVWHGWRPATPSGIPYVGKLPEHARVWAAVGFIGLGVTMAPAVGAALASAILGDEGRIPPELSRSQPDL